jgi:hypothetical protein
MTIDFTTRTPYAGRSGAVGAARRESMGPADPPVPVSTGLEAQDDPPADFVQAFARRERR